MFFWILSLLLLDVSSSDNQTGFKIIGNFASKAYAMQPKQNDPPEWHVRLSIAMPSVGLEDYSNTLGISPKGLTGRDLLDISDQPRPPWSENYLDLVFPHPDWGGELTDYSSDFRQAGSDSKIESWRFEVRTNIRNEEVVFSWHGPATILAHCQLRDGNTGKLLVADPVKEGYSFAMTGPVQEFIWEYHY